MRSYMDATVRALLAQIHLLLFYSNLKYEEHTSAALTSNDHRTWVTHK